MWGSCDLLARGRHAPGANLCTDREPRSACSTNSEGEGTLMLGRNGYDDARGGRSSVVGRLVTHVGDDACCPLVGEVIEQIDDGTVMVMWAGDRRAGAR